MVWGRKHEKLERHSGKPPNFSKPLSVSESVWRQYAIIHLGIGVCSLAASNMFLQSSPYVSWIPEMPLKGLKHHCAGEEETCSSQNKWNTLIPKQKVCCLDLFDRESKSQREQESILVCLCESVLNVWGTNILFLQKMWWHAYVFNIFFRSEAK